MYVGEKCVCVCICVCVLVFVVHDLSKSELNYVMIVVGNIGFFVRVRNNKGANGHTCVQDVQEEGYSGWCTKTWGAHTHCIMQRRTPWIMGNTNWVLSKNLSQQRTRKSLAFSRVGRILR